MDTMKSYACSFVGKRKNNEDSYIDLTPAEGFRLFAVADGMGGANAGEIASSLAIETISNFFKKELIPDSDYSDDELKSLIIRGYQKIQSEIDTSIKEDASLSGMGTTLVILLYAKGRWLCGNLGDSRLYLVRKNSLELITKDHSLLQQYLDVHGIAPDEVWVKKYSNYLVKALDGGDSIPDIYILTEERISKGGSCFILCSDGILSEKKPGSGPPIKEIVCNAKDVRDAAEQLVSHAFYQGSADNITVILVEAEGFVHKNNSGITRLPFPPTENASAPEVKVVNKRLISVILSAIFLCIVGILFLLYRNNIKNQQGGANPPKQVIVSASPSYKEGFSISSDQIKKDAAKRTGSRTEPTITWQAFNQDDYKLPVNGSTMVIWNPLNASSLTVSGYKIRICMESKVVDSLEVRPGTNSVRFDSFKKLQAAKKYSAEIIANLSNGKNARGNRITFIYH